MPAPTEPPLTWQMIQMMKVNMEGISTAEGYYTDIAAVYIDQIAPENIQFPCIFLTVIELPVKKKANKFTDVEIGIFVTGMIEFGEDMNLKCHQLIDDITKAVPTRSKVGDEPVYELGEIAGRRILPDEKDNPVRVVEVDLTMAAIIK